MNMIDRLHFAKVLMAVLSCTLLFSKALPGLAAEKLTLQQAIARATQTDPWLQGSLAREQSLNLSSSAAAAPKRPS